MTHRKKILLYKVFVWLFVFVLIFAGGSGLRNPDINNRALCIVMGIDVGEKDKVSAAVQIVVSEPQGTGKQMIITEEGGTLSEALDRINSSIGQRVQLGHCGLIILGNEYVKNCIFPELNYLLSSGRVNPDVNLVAAHDMQAKEVLSKLNDLSKVVSEGINSIVAYADKGVHVSRVGVLSFLSESFSSGKSSAIPCVELGQDKYGGEGSGGSGESSSSSSGDEQKSSSSGSGGSGGEGGSRGQTVIRNINSMVALKNGAYRGMLSPEGTRGKAWLNKSSVEGLILLKDIKSDDKTIDSLSCNLIKKSIKTKAQFKDGKPVYTVKLKIQISVEDKYGITEIIEETGNDGIYKAVKDSMKELVIRQISRGIKESKELDCDVFGINEQFNKSAHKKFKAYGDVLQDVEIKYDVEVRLF